MADYKSLLGVHLVVSAVKEKPNGKIEIRMKREDGRKFFRNFTSVPVNLEKALEVKELKRLKSN